MQAKRRLSPIDLKKYYTPHNKNNCTTKRDINFRDNAAKAEILDSVLAY